MKNKKTTAIILAAGSGRRMQSSTAKQYLLLGGKPILYYSIKAFEDSSVDEIILVAGKGELDFCRTSILEKYNFKKITHITEGGNERYYSVYNGLKEIACSDNVLIHDGVRPFVSIEIIENAIQNLNFCDACVVGVPSKDTVKFVNNDGIIRETPDRSKIWTVQTPQAFSYDIIMQAYSIVMDKMAYNRDKILCRASAGKIAKKDNENKSGDMVNITDDAMVVEYSLNCPVKMIMGSYSNIKITTPEDLLIGEALLKNYL